MQVTIAHTRRERIRGLLGRGGLAPNEALLIPRARAVHTIGMAFPIDVAYVDARGRVLEVVTMRPGRIGWPRLKARQVLECAVGCAPSPGTLAQEIQTGPSDPVTSHSPSTSSTICVPPEAQSPPQ